MKTGYERVSLLDDEERIKNGRYQLTFRFCKNNKRNSLSATSIDDIIKVMDDEDIDCWIIDKDAARDLYTLEKKLMSIDDNFYKKMDDLEEKEEQIVLEKQKLRKTRRQERSELLREYQKKYKGDGL